MTRTAAQRYNEKMHRIFEEAKVLKAKHAPKHAFQVLGRMTEKVKRAYSIQQNLTQEDWNELNKICREAEEVLEYAPKEYVVQLKEVEEVSQ
jgi:hypothetical protein